MGRPKGGRGLEQVVCYYCGPKKPKISEKNYKRHLRDIHNDHSAVSKVYGYKALRFNKGGGRRSHTGDGESMHNVKAFDVSEVVDRMSSAPVKTPFMM